MPILTPTRRGVIAGGLALAVAPRPAAAIESSVLRRQIVLAGRQRMLTQRIARAALFRALDIDAARHKRMLKQAHGVFGRSITALRTGDTELGIPATEDARVGEALDEVARLWGTLGPAAERMISAKTETPSDQGVILTGNLPLLVASNAVVQALVLTNTGSQADMGPAIAINVAARQRMLTQKMAKEVAMIAIGHEAEASRRQLGKTADVFEQTLEALLTGLPTVTLPAPTLAIKAKLVEAQAMWDNYQTVIRFVAETGVASGIDLAAVAVQADPLMLKINEAVQLYQAG